MFFIPKIIKQMAITVKYEFDPEQLTPVVESSVFESHPEAPFWIGRVATGNVIEKPREYFGAHILRANIYIDQEGFLPAEARSANGGEYDTDDDRSVQFATLENHNQESRVIGTVRLVEKRNRDDILPAEEIFPEAFKDAPAEVGSVEVSRLIAKHSEPLTQTYAALAAIRASDLYCIENGVPNTYAVVERPLYVYLSRMGVPCEKMSELKVTPEYGDTENMVVRINPMKLHENATDIESKYDLLRKFYDGALESLGLGHFNKDFLPHSIAVEV